jgi:hypothetical protein
LEVNWKQFQKNCRDRCDLRECDIPEFDTFSKDLLFQEAFGLQYSERSSSIFKSFAWSYSLHCLIFHASKVGGGCGFNEFQPVLSIKNPFPIVGEKVEMQAFLSTYSSNPRPLGFSFDDQIISPINGYGKFKKNYQKAKVFEPKLKIWVKNKETKQIDTIEQTIKLRIKA